MPSEEKLSTAFIDAKNNDGLKLEDLKSLFNYFIANDVSDTCRNEFIKNLLKMLYDASLTESNFNEIKKYISKITSGEIMIIDIYKYFKSSSISFEDFKDFLDNYDYIDSYRRFIYKNVYVGIINSITLADLLKTFFKKNQIFKKKVLVYPKIKISYLKNQDYFITDYDAFITYLNIFETVRESLPACSITTESSLFDLSLKLTSEQEQKNSILFGSSFNKLSNKLADVYNMPTVNNEDASDIDLLALQLLRDNDYTELINRLLIKLANTYIIDLEKGLTTKDFKVEDYLNVEKITLDDIVTVENYKLNIFEALLLSKTTNALNIEKLSLFNNQILELKNILNAYYAAYESDGRFDVPANN